MIYIFDIDGTLTAPRQPMNNGFKKFFLYWIKNKEVYLVTGSDREKAVEQVGEVLDNVNGYFTNAGNVYYKKNKVKYTNEWSPSLEVVSFLEELITESYYPIKCGNHIERRIGMLNFSIVGRNCTQKERKKYYYYDKLVHEREFLCKRIMEKFPTLEAVIGGQISIDIFPCGMNKGQILQYFNKNDVFFFGDKTERGGNDYSLASKLEPSHVLKTIGWLYTMNVMRII